MNRPAQGTPETAIRTSITDLCERLLRLIGLLSGAYPRYLPPAPQYCSPLIRTPQVDGILTIRFMLT